VLVKLVGDQFGFDGAFWFQATLLVIGALFLTRVDVPDHEEVRTRRPILTETREAVRHILDDTHLTTLFALLFTSSFTINPAVMVTLQAHVKDGLGRTAGEAALPFALMGLGIALKSVWDVGEHLRAGRLVNLLPEWSSEEDGVIQAVRPPGPYTPAKVRAFIDFLKGKYGPHPYWETP